MKRALLLLTLTGVLSVGVFTASASAHGYDRKCGDHPGGVGAGWYNVKSFNTKCHEARDTAAHYFNHYYTARDSHFNGWTCHAKQKGEELFKASCVRNRSRHQHIKFEFGS